MDPLIQVDSVTVNVTVSTTVNVTVRTDLSHDIETGACVQDVAAGTPVGASGE